MRRLPNDANLDDGRVARSPAHHCAWRQATTVWRFELEEEACDLRTAAPTGSPLRCGRRVHDRNACVCRLRDRHRIGACPVHANSSQMRSRCDPVRREADAARDNRDAGCNLASRWPRQLRRRGPAADPHGRDDQARRCGSAVRFSCLTSRLKEPCPSWSMGSSRRLSQFETPASPCCLWSSVWRKALRLGTVPTYCRLDASSCPERPRKSVTIRASAKLISACESCWVNSLSCKEALQCCLSI